MTVGLRCGSGEGVVGAIQACVRAGFLAMGCAAVVGCGSAPALGVQTARAGGASECPHLDSNLFALTKSADPQGFATSHAMNVDGAGVRVLIELSHDSFAASSYGVTVEARYDMSMQARVPISALCEMSRDPAVLSVAVGAPPRPGSGAP